MIRILKPFVGGLIILFLTIKPALATQMAEGSAVLKNAVLGFQPSDLRVQKLAKFLDNYQSPLTPYAQNFVAAADEYQIDWKLVPAIAGVESTFGKRIPSNSYNAYGWANGTYGFESWKQSIEYVTKYLAEKYYARGLNNPFKIGPVYAPPSKTWANKVTFFMKKIECFEEPNCLNGFEITL